MVSQNTIAIMAYIAIQMALRSSTKKDYLRKKLYNLLEVKHVSDKDYEHAKKAVGMNLK